VVVPFDIALSDEAFDARRAIELGVVELATGSLTATQLRELRARFAAMARQLVGERFVDFDAYLDANHEFHEAVVALAGNPALSEAFRRLNTRTVMARAFGPTPVTSQLFIEVQRALLDAFVAGDAAAARAAVHRYATVAKERAREVLALTGGRI
jgi:DNA-binding GntR family transcriptional regulator